MAVNADTAGFQSSLGGANSAVKGLMGTMALTAGAAFLGSAVKDAQEAEKASGQLDSILRTMGTTISTTTRDVEKWSTALQKKTAIDDDQIKVGAAQLLTFERLRGGIGSTDTGMKRVLETTTGLSKFWKTDMTSASVQVGKALDDPIGGLTALRRVGIIFSDDQERVIKNLVETGRTAEAQTLILDELGKQGGNAGLEMATGSEKAAAAMKEAKESIGAALLPAVTSLAKAVTPLAEAFGALPGPVKAGVLAFAGFALVGPRLIAVGKALGTIGPAAAKLGPAVAGGIAKIAPLVTSGLAALAPILAAAMPWILIVAGIAIAAVLIYKFFTSELPGKIGEALKDAGKWLLDKGKDLLQGLWDGVLSKVVDFYKFLYVDLPLAIFGVLKDIGKWLWEKGGDLLQGLWDGVLSKVVGFYKWFYVDMPLAVLGAVKDAGKWLFNVGKDIVMGLINGILSIAGRIKDTISNIVGGIPGFIKGMLGIGSPSKVMAGIGANMMEGLAVGISGAGGLPQGAMSSAVGGLTVPTVRMSGGRLASTGGTAPITINLDLRNAVVGVDDLVDKVAAGLAERDRRVGTALR